MKVLLRQDVPELGWLGDVVEVSRGYATNYLLPQGLAVIPTEANLKSLAKEKAKLAHQRMLQRKRLEQLAQEIQGTEVTIAAAANEQGYLFGSVSASKIATNLREQGFEVTDQMVKLSPPIKQLGNFSVTVELAKDLTATINVIVVRHEETQGSEQGRENESAGHNG